MRPVRKLRLFFILLVSSLACFPAYATVILQYHHVSEETPAATSISPELFSRHLDYLESEKFNVISLPVFIDSLKQNQSLPDKSVVITFDDGYRNIYRNAFPLLKAKGFPFTVFINSQPVIQKLSNFMTLDEMREMIVAGASIANHSASHPHMLRLRQDESEQAWLERMRREVSESQQYIEKHLGQTVKAFAYPYGEFNLQLTHLITEMGFVGFAQHSGAVPEKPDLAAIPRFPFGGVYGSIDDFKTKVYSLPLPVERASLTDDGDQPLSSHILEPEKTMPKLRLGLKPGFEKLVVSCFLSGQGKLESSIDQEEIVFSPNAPLSVGRSRFNCTAASGTKGRFYWFSQPVIRKHTDGSWYKE